jgi:hypothetical protein
MSASSIPSSVSAYPIQTPQSSPASSASAPLQAAVRFLGDGDGDHQSQVSPVTASPAASSSSAVLAALSNLQPGG